ncbi:hypothetical protein ASZ90_003173 [hydrocarbon metagenome]|uniref:Uncharacterized protein n=1 Tax=hydrocarbon metagenome TaxID=938273 RepID=A0A0W8G1G3_9ZZZZ
MKKMQKFILPVLIIAAVAIMYFGYFAPRDGLGSFSKFDPNSHASHEIIVSLVKEKGVRLDRASGESIFYVIDADGREVLVSGPSSLPPGMNDAPTIVLVGHLNRNNSFHAHDVRIRN